MEKNFAWVAKAAPYFIAIPMGIFGVQHFIYLQFVADFIPAWIPWRTFWACFTGGALIASAVGIGFRIWDRWAATLLGVMIFLWVLLLHTSRIAAKPAEFGEWRGIFQALGMSGCAFILAQFLEPARPRVSAPPTSVVGTLTTLSELGAGLAPYFLGSSMAALGLEHFIFADVSAPQVPVWIPGTIMGNYLSGIALVTLGVGICFEPSRRRSAAWLGILIFLSMIFLHLPAAFRSPRFESDWTKTLVLSGGACLLVVARKKTDRQREFHKRSPLSARVEGREETGLRNQNG